MSPRKRDGGPATGYLSPSGQLWQVPAFPRPQIVLDATAVTVDGRRYPVQRGQEPRDAATAPLVELALRLRGEAGAIHADVTTAGSPGRWQVIVTATGEVFDATPTGTGGRRRNSRLLLAGGGVLVAVLGLTTALVVVTSQTEPAPPAVVAAGPAPTGTPVPYPQLPPPGFSGTAAWSAPVDGRTTPVITTTGQVVTVSAPEADDTTLDVRDPRTGIVAWSAQLPRGAGTGAQGLRLSQVDGQEAVVATTSDTLVWWPVEGDDHTPRTLKLPTGATVSYAGSTPLLTWPGQRAGLITDGALTEMAVPAGAVAVGATDGTVVATDSVGQLWRLTAATAEFPPAPIATAALVGGATGLESVAGYAAPSATTTGSELLILTWYTEDPGTRVVSLLDATTGAAVGTPTTVARGDVGSSGWRASEHNTVGVVGQVLIDTATPAIHALPDGWRTTAVTDTQVYGTQNSARLVAAPDGTTSPTGSGTTPLGTAAGLVVVTAAVGNTTTVYGLPVATTPAGPTPSVDVAAPPALRPTNPVPGPAPTPAPPAESPAPSSEAGTP